MQFDITNSTQGNQQIDFGGNRTTEGFYQLARRIEKILHINYTHKSDDFNTLRWKYSYEGVPFVLKHHWDAGTIICVDRYAPSDTEKETFNVIATTLRNY